MEGIVFNELSLEDKLNHFHDVAERAKGMWGCPKETTLKLLNFSENATFLAEWGEDNRRILRVHRIEFAEKNNIRTELNWIQAVLKDTSLNVTTPIESTDGNLIETIETKEMNEKRHVVCFEYVEGKAPKDSSDDNEKLAGLLNSMEKIPTWITFPLFKGAAVLNARTGKKQKNSQLTEDDRKMYRTLGEIAATLHKQSKDWEVPEWYDRMEWDWEGTFGTEWNNFYGADYRDTECLSARDINTLNSCVTVMKHRLNIYGKSADRYGMIHSDLRMANLLKKGDKITVLDFDDCGRGWYMYDIAGIVALMEHRADINEVVREVVKGYETVREVSDADIGELPTFIMMRRIGMLQSLNYRLGDVMTGDGDEIDLTPEVLVYYAKGTVELAKDYLKMFQYREVAGYIDDYSKVALPQI